MALVVKNTPANSGDVRQRPGSGSSLEGGHGTLLQYSCLENRMDRGAWWATVHGVAKSWTWLKQLSMHPCMSSKKASLFNCPCNSQATAQPRNKMSPKHQSPDDLLLSNTMPLKALESENRQFRGEAQGFKYTVQRISFFLL